jgi:hypothetical protein
VAPVDAGVHDLGDLRDDEVSGPGQPDEQLENQHASLRREFENLQRRFGSTT